MELISRFLLYLTENSILMEVTIPLFIILGRPREYFQYNDQYLFQLNYLALRPISDNLNDNWFLEALNFHKVKNMILFLKLCRYVILLGILTIILSPNQMLVFFKNLKEFKFSKMFFSYVKLIYNIIIEYLYKDVKNKKYYLISFPFFLVSIFKNIFMTRDMINFFLIHLLIGMVISLLEEKDKKIKRNVNHRRATVSAGNLNLNLN